MTPQTEVLKGPAKAHGGDLIGFETNEGFAIQQDITLGWTVNATYEIEDGGLTRAIGSDQTPDLSGFDLEVVVIYSPEPAEIVAHIFNLQQWHVAPGFYPRSPFVRRTSSKGFFFKPISGVME
jgi:hypothetical protein